MTWGAWYLYLSPINLIRLQSLLSLFFFFYLPTVKLRVTSSFLMVPAQRRLGQLNRVWTSYKRFHAGIPDLVHLKFRGLWRSLAQRPIITKKSESKVSSWSVLIQRQQHQKHFFYSPRKFRSGRLINYRKNFRVWQRTYYHKLKETFYLGQGRPHATKRLLARFHNKSILMIGLMLSLNPMRLLARLFPFFDRFMIKNLIASGLVWVNFRQLSPKMHTFNIGDFVHIAWGCKFNTLYLTWMLRQQSYVYEMSKNLRHYYKSLRQISLNRHKNYLRRFTWYTHLYAKTPRWLEVNYLSLSFFIVKMPNKLTFTSSNFNPFLNRLMAF